MGVFSNIWDKLFRKDKSFDKEIKAASSISVEGYGNLSSTLISFSDASYMSSLAARICIGQGPEEDYEKRLSHIRRVLERGHESTIAHSNIVILLVLDKEFDSKFVEVSHALKFADFVSYKQENESTAVLIGGSIRAYKYFFREVKDLSNPICSVIKETLYQAAESVFFEDLIKDGIMDKDKFSYYPMASTKEETEELIDEEGNAYTETFADLGEFKPVSVVNGKVCDIMYADDVYSVLDKVSRYGFKLRDVLKLTTCTVLFHDVSRAVSHQLVRHYAGICQESQRYVDYSNSEFVDPLQFNPQKYDVNKTYTIHIGGTKYEGTSTELAELILPIYHQFIEQGMLKQDSRSFLLTNMKTKVLMTFTFANLIHFIKERDCDAAQPETHSAAGEMVDNLLQYDLTSYLFITEGLDNLIKLCETPVYKNTQDEDLMKLDNSIDEVISEEEEIQ